MPTDLAVGQFLGGVLEPAANHRFRGKPVLLEHVFDHGFEGVELFRHVDYLLGDPFTAPGIGLRTHVDNDEFF